MRKALLLIIIFMTVASKGKSQSFINYAKMLSVSNYQNDSIFLRDYFDVTVSDAHQPLADIVCTLAFKNLFFLGISCRVTCSAGGHCESTQLRIFNNKGELIDEKWDYSHHYASLGEENRRDCIYLSDTLFILVDNEIITQPYTDSIIKNEIKVYQHLINQDGIISLRDEYSINTSRQHYQTSCKYFSQNELKGFKKDELGKMRNEIYASYGYIFKSPCWKEYFTQYDWYKPERYDVEEYLTNIEKHNITLIREFEKKK